MRQTWAVLWLGLLAGGGGCRRPRSPEPARPTEAPVGVGGPARAPQPVGKYQISGEKLDGYIQYQRALQAAWDQGALGRLKRGRSDAGSPRAVIHALMARAQVDQQARVQAHLSEEDVEHLEEMVQEVMGERSVSDSPDLRAAIAQYQAIALKLAPESRKELSATVEQLDNEADAGRRLAGPRGRFGDANVDLILSREPALRETWEGWLKRLGDK